MDHRRGLALTLSCSIALHAVALALWHERHARDLRDPHRTPAARTLVVRLRAAPTPAALVAPDSATAALPPKQLSRPAAATKQPARKPTAAVVKAVPAPHAPAAPVEATTEPPPPDPAPPAAPVGATAFAGLFAPLVGRPMGHGGWARRTVAAARPPDEARAPEPPEQALAALRTTLLERLGSLGRTIALDHREALHCDIAVDGSRRTAEIRCDDPADRAAPWAALGALLAPGAVTPREADLCFTLGPAQVAAIACAADGPHAGP